MMKKRFSAVVFYIIAVAGVYCVDFTHTIYLPSLYGRAVGLDVIWNRFEGHKSNQFSSIPILEMKFVVAHIGNVALNASAGFTLYAESNADSDAYSGNVSLGIGVGTLGKEIPTSMQGFFIHAYPLYEFPVAAGGVPIAPWKTALDAGYALDLGVANRLYGIFSLYIAFYSRMIGAFADIDGGTKFYLNWPDFGVAVGGHIFWEKPL
jgi:hypothetical protein